MLAERTSRESRIFGALDSGYASILHWSLSHRAVIAGIAVLVLLSSVPLFMVANKNFLPNDDQAEFRLVRAPEGTSLEATEIIANRIASSSAAAGVSYTLVSVADDPPGRELGTIYRLTPVDDATRPVRADERRAERILPAVIPNLRTGVRPVATISGGNQNAEIQFTISPDLCGSSNAPAGHGGGEERPGVVDLDTSLNVGSRYPWSSTGSRPPTSACRFPMPLMRRLPVAATRLRPTTKVNNTRSTSSPSRKSPDGCSYRAAHGPLDHVAACRSSTSRG